MRSTINILPLEVGAPNGVFNPFWMGMAAFLISTQLWSLLLRGHSTESSNELQKLFS